MRALPLPENGDGVLCDGSELVPLRELRARAARLAHELRAAGVAPGEALALECTNHVACALALLHALDSGRTLLLLPGGAAAPPTPPAFRHRLRFAPEAGAAPELVPNSTHAPDAAAAPRSLYLCTSGTTGESRFAVHDQARLIENARACARRFELGAGDRVALPVPIHHLFGLGAGFLPALLAGASADLQHDANLPRFLARERDFEPGVAFMTPAFAESLLRGRRGARRYRLTVMAGDRLREESFDRYEERFGNVVQLYGSSELGAIAATRPGDPRAVRRASVGRPLDGVALRLAAEPAGELECRHAHGFDGYADATGRLGPRHDTGAWHPTRDLARFDADGNLVILGRLDHCVKRDGLLVALGEVEAALEAQDGVAAAAAVAAGATPRGRGIVAFCTARGDAPPAGELRRALAERLPRRAVPDAIEWVAALPLLESGKLDRRALARRAEELLRPAPPPVRFVQLEPTTRCNFSCGFCAGRHMDQTDLPFEVFERTLAEFPGIEEIELHGQGETLLHPRVWDMADAARARGIRVSTLSNGSLLTPAHIERILAAGIHSILVSIESADAEAFERIRGGRLEKVARGIEALLAERRRRGLDRPVVGFAVTVLRDTRHELGAIAGLYRRLGMDGGIALHMLIPMQHHARHYDAAMQAQLLSPTEQALVWARYQKLQRDPELRAAAVHACDRIYGYGEMLAAGRPDALEGYQRCPFLEAGFYVQRNARVTACSRILDGERFGLGTLGKDTPEAILARRGEMDRRVRSGLVPEPCQDCFIAESIRSRMQNLLAARPSAGAARAGAGDADPALVDALLARCDGRASAGEILADLAAEWGVGADEARMRALPVLAGLVQDQRVSLR